MLPGFVDVSGLTYPEVLTALHRGANPLEGQRKARLDPEELKAMFADPEALVFVKEYRGAFIGVQFWGNVLDVQCYDGMNGEGMGQIMIDEVRRIKEKQAKEPEAMLKLVDEEVDVPMMTVHTEHGVVRVPMRFEEDYMMFPDAL